MSTLVEKLEELAKVIPTSWLDSLLSGPESVIRKSPCPEIEDLLNAIRKRLKDGIRALLANHAKEGDAEEPWNGPWVCEGGHTFEPPYDEVAVKYLAANNPVCIFDKSPLHHHERRSRPAPATPDGLRDFEAGRVKIDMDGLYKGWVSIRHADGQWVTAMKLEPFSMAILSQPLSGSPRKEGE